MNCSCTFDLWIKELFLGFGAAGGFLLLGMFLLVWGTRKVRREHITQQTTWGMIIKMNWPAWLLMSLGTLTWLATLTAALFTGVMK